MPATLDEEWAYWDTKATELRRTQLSTIQTAATKWTALLTAALGIFSAVAFAGGLTTIDELDSPYNIIAKALTSGAALADLVAIIILAIVAGGLSPVATADVTPSTIRDMNTVISNRLLESFRWGRRVAILAASFVLIGSAVVLWAPQAASSATSVLVVSGGKASCGELEATSNDTLSVGGIEVSSGVDHIVVVTKCP